VNSDGGGELINDLTMVQMVDARTGRLYPLDCHKCDWKNLFLSRPRSFQLILPPRKYFCLAWLIKG
jgi:hypothetical protein